MDKLETLKVVESTLRDEIQNAPGTWKEKLKFREEAVKTYYETILEIAALRAPDPNARIFRVPFATAPLYYQQKKYKGKAELFYCPDVEVCTIGALLLTTPAGAELTNGSDSKKERSVHLPFEVVKREDGVVHLKLLETPVKGSITLNINIARAVLSTFHELPEGDPSLFRVGYHHRPGHPNFTNVYWREAK